MPINPPSLLPYKERIRSAYLILSDTDLHIVNTIYISYTNSMITKRIKLSDLPITNHYAHCETCDQVHDRSQMTRIEDFGYLCDRCTGHKEKPSRSFLGATIQSNGNEKEEALMSANNNTFRELMYGRN